MPELPEVESTVRYLRERCIGTMIRDVEVRWPRTISTSTPEHFRSALLGRTIAEVFRSGKFVGLKIDREDSQFLFIHLRMSGSLDVVSTSAEDDKHDRVIISLDSQKCIRFNDTRKFGRMYLWDSPSVLAERLGIDPLSELFTVDILHRILMSRRGRIKTTLLDQTLVAGLGNIYVDESLWKAKIHPMTPCSEIPRSKISALHSAIRETLTEAIELAGTDFGDGVVYGGMYRPLVYGRADEPCHRCGATIKRVVVAQRGTHICCRCQRPPLGSAKSA